MNEIKKIRNCRKSKVGKKRCERRYLNNSSLDIEEGMHRGHGSQRVGKSTLLNPGVRLTSRHTGQHYTGLTDDNIRTKSWQKSEKNTSHFIFQDKLDTDMTPIILPRRFLYPTRRQKHTQQRVQEMAGCFHLMWAFEKYPH